MSVPKLSLRSWPKILALSLGAIPVGVFIAMIVALSLRAEGAVTDLSGPQRAIGATPTPDIRATPTATIPKEKPVENLKKLFGTEFSTQLSSGTGRYGLRPAIIGTISLVVVAMALALPISLAMGVFSSEFPLWFLGRWLRVLLGILAGIPPIVYALLAVVFVGPFISNKFAADWVGPSDPRAIGPEGLIPGWPPPDVPWNAGAFPWDPTGGDNSLILASIMLSLLVVPFLAPLIEDALRNVPREPKEASLGLGATKWYTLRRITIPRAMPGIIAATGLGTLKVLGDVMIVYFVVGIEAGMPNPLFDLLERTAPLTSTGAALVGGVNNPDACNSNPRDCSVGYFSAMLLLVMALVIVVATTVLESRFRKRLGV
jgi:ABC-type phosphate transport system permease subunit